MVVVVVVVVVVVGVCSFATCANYSTWTANTTSVVSYEEAAAIGYHPLDDAERYRDTVSPALSRNFPHAPTMITRSEAASGPRTACPQVVVPLIVMPVAYAAAERVDAATPDWA